MSDSGDIQLAVMIADVPSVQTYIDRGGDLECMDDDGSTPLFHAAFWRHEGVTKLLIAAGCRSVHCCIGRISDIENLSKVSLRLPVRHLSICTGSFSFNVLRLQSPKTARPGML